MIFNKWIVRGLSRWSKAPCGSPTISEIYWSSSVKTSRPACTTTYSKDGYVGAYSIGLTLLGKQGYPSKKKLKCRT